MYIDFNSFERIQMIITLERFDTLQKLVELTMKIFKGKVFIGDKTSKVFSPASRFSV